MSDYEAEAYAHRTWAAAAIHKMDEAAHRIAAAVYERLAELEALLAGKDRSYYPETESERQALRRIIAAGEGAARPDCCVAAAGVEHEHRPAPSPTGGVADMMALHDAVNGRVSLRRDTVLALAGALLRVQLRSTTASDAVVYGTAARLLRRDAGEET